MDKVDFRKLKRYIARINKFNTIQCLTAAEQVEYQSLLARYYKAQRKG